MAFSTIFDQLDANIRKMKKTPASGYDSISGLVLSDIYDSIKQVILHLINLSLCTGVFPQVFKITKIIPVLKNGKDPTIPSSYRPVSNLSTLGKLVEQATMQQVKLHIKTHNLTNKDQHGGRGGHSTTTCVVELLEDIKTAQENRLKTALVAIDLSAAFDMCNHKILLEKCRLLALDSPTMKWLSSFFAARQQVVEIAGKK